MTLATNPDLYNLNPREVETLRLAAAGLDNSSIARRMKTTEQVVKNRWQRIYEKTRASNRGHAMVIALRRGVVK